MPKSNDKMVRSRAVKARKADKSATPVRWSLRVQAQKERERAEAEKAEAEMERQRVEAEKERQRAEAEAEAEAKKRKLRPPLEASALAEGTLESASSMRSDVTVEEVTAELTEYERLRAENIRRNNEILQSLGIDTVKAALEGGREKISRPKIKVPCLPVRRSARVRAREAGDVEELGSVKPPRHASATRERIKEEEDLSDDEYQPVVHAVCETSTSIKSDEEEALALPLNSSLRAWSRSVRSKAVDAFADWTGGSHEPGENLLETEKKGCPSAPHFAHLSVEICTAQDAGCSVNCTEIKKNEALPGEIDTPMTDGEL